MLLAWSNSALVLRLLTVRQFILYTYKRINIKIIDATAHSEPRNANVVRAHLSDDLVRKFEDKEDHLPTAEWPETIAAVIIIYQHNCHTYKCSGCVEHPKSVVSN